MPSLRIVALSVIIFGSLACSEEQSTTTTVTTGADVCVDDATYFAQTLWPGVLQNKCLGCHNAQGIARETEFVLQPAAQPGYMETNQEVVTYLASLERDGTSFILLKPTEAVPHGGGLVLSEGSAEYDMLAQFAERAREPVVCETEPTVTTDPLAGVTMMSYPRTLRKAMLALGGRLPTADEFDTVDRLGATGVELVLMNMMKEERFLDRLKELFNDVLLTDRFLGGNNMLERLDRERYPAYWFESTPLDEDLTEDQERNIRRRLRDRANDGTARAALELMAFVVAEDRPFSEVLTADYMMVNPFSARSYGVTAEEGAFPDGADYRDYDVKHFFPVALPEVPTAGILTTSAWLNRFPTTDTNRNRHRAWVLMRRFLATDILRLADRPVDPTSSQVFNPTMNDPQCTVCHTALDPVSGAFQNWDNNGRYRPRENGWYGEMVPPAYEDEAIPSGEWSRALPWFAERTVTDARFPLAVTQLMFELFIGEELIIPPHDPSAPGAALQQAQFDLQTQILDEIQTQFITSNMNLKTLLVKLVLSPYFRGEAVDPEVASEAAVALAGSPRILTPESLDRKLKAVTGFPWQPRAGTNNQLLVDYRMLYGGIDSNGVTKRLKTPNGLMANIGLRMANEVACWVTAKDFTLDKAQRRLFPFVERSFEPETSDGFAIPGAQTKIRENIRYLFRRVLDEEHRLDSAEVERAYALFHDTWTEGKALLAADEAPQALHYYCRAERDHFTWDALPAERRITYDRNYVVRAWMSVLTYMLADYRFLYE